MASFEHRFSQQGKTLIGYCGSPPLHHLQALIQNDTGHQTDVVTDTARLASQGYGHAFDLFWRTSCFILLLSTVVIILYLRRNRTPQLKNPDNVHVSKGIHLL